MASTILLALIAIIPIATAADTDLQSVPLDGTNGNIIDVSARGTYLWCIDSSNAVFQFDFGSGKWQSRPNTGITTGLPRKVAATNEGGAWVSTGEGGGNYQHRWFKGATAWKIAVARGFPTSAIHDNDAVAPFGMTYLYRIDGTNYPLIQSSAGFAGSTGVNNAIWAGIGEKNEAWYVDTENKIYRFNGDTKKWDPKSDNLTACSVDLQCRQRVVMTGNCGKAYIRNGERWDELPFNNVKFTTINYDAVYAVTKDGKVFKYAVPGFNCGCDDDCPVWGRGP